MGADLRLEPTAQPFRLSCVQISDMGDRLKDKVALVTGAGSIGQLVLLVARAYGASSIAMSDVEAFPRDFAISAGADFVFDPRNDEINSFAANDAIDVIIEVSGSPIALAQSLRLVGRGGTVVQVGTQPASVELPINLVLAIKVHI